MLGAALAAVGIVVLLAVVFVVGLAFVRRRWGLTHQELFMATTQFVMAIIFDLMVFLFSISFCTAAIKEALRLRGRGGANPLLEDFWLGLGSESPDVGSQWGLIIPIMSWLCAHGVILSALLLLRHLGGVVRERSRAEESETAEAFDTGLLHSSGGLIASLIAFWYTIGQDTLLIRFQMIASSKPLKEMLGADWSASLTQRELIQKLSGSFVGELVVHSGAFYAVTLLVAAFVIVVAFHNVMRVINRLPRRTYQVVPPDLPLGPPPPLGPEAQVEGGQPVEEPPIDVPTEGPPPDEGDEGGGFYMPPED